MNIIMTTALTRFTLISSLLLLCFSGTALAHVKIKETSPANNVHLITAPTELALSFEHPVTLTKLTLTDAKGGDVNFTVNNKLVDTHKFPLTSLNDGHYTVNWSAKDKGGHILSGHFNFIVGAMPKDHQHKSK
ncbi:MAG: copper resistance CopC family protein [Pseudomonadota bacterium]